MDFSVRRRWLARAGPARPGLEYRAEDSARSRAAELKLEPGFLRQPFEGRRFLGGWGRFQTQRRWRRWAGCSGGEPPQGTVERRWPLSSESGKVARRRRHRRLDSDARNSRRNQPLGCARARRPLHPSRQDCRDLATHADGRAGSNGRPLVPPIRPACLDMGADWVSRYRPARPGPPSLPAPASPTRVGPGFWSSARAVRVGQPDQRSGYAIQSPFQSEFNLRY